MLKDLRETLRMRNFEQFRDRISQENQAGTELLLFCDACILLLNVLVETVAGKPLGTNRTLLAQIVSLLVVLPVYLLVLRRRNTNYTRWIYLVESPMLVIPMVGGIYDKPDELTFTFLFILLLFPLLILDKPWRIGLFLVVMGTGYAMVDHAVKRPEVFSRDIVHLINVVLMAFSASLYLLSVRIKNIKYAGFFAEKADRDPLTGLYNRFGAKRHIDPRRPGLMIYLDLDRFKEVNDRYGHAEGDRVLLATAGVIRTCFRKEDVPVRMGGDEFAIYAEGTWSVEAVEAKLSHLLERIHAMDAKIAMTASIGCACAPAGCGSLDQLVGAADRAMYQVKGQGKNGYLTVVIPAPSK